MRKKLRKINGYGIILINTIPYLGIANAIKRLKHGNGIILPLFHEAWYNYPDTFIERPIRFFIRLSIKSIVKQSSNIIAVSNPTAKSLHDNYKVPKDGLFVVPLGLKKERDFVKNNKGESDLTACYVGRLSKIKKIDTLLNAVKMMQYHGHRLRVKIVGDGPIREELEKKCQLLNIADSVEFTGFISENKKKDILKRSLFFVMPSEREGFSLATLEAMSLGVIPIVAMPNYPELFGIGHYLKNGVNGVTFQVGDSSDLTHKMLQLIMDRSMCDYLRKNAIMTADKYSWDSSADILNDIFLNRLKE